MVSPPIPGDVLDASHALYTCQANRWDKLEMLVELIESTAQNLSRDALQNECYI